MGKDSDKPSSAFTQELTVHPTASGSLDGLTFAAKDVFDVAGHRTGFGNALWDATHSIASSHARCIALLLNAGASCRGKTVLGEFCCGIEGKNSEYGMAINPANPDLVPGGSSSGSASAVASGDVDFSLGTDTGGSIRVPANNCALFGMRPTHGRISMRGCLSLSESLDTVGVLSRSLRTLKQVMQALLSEDKVGDTTISMTTLFLIDDLLAESTPEIRRATLAFADKFAAQHNLEISHISMESFDEPDMSIADVMRLLICGETWKNLGEWVEEHSLEYGKTTHVDFSFMRTVSKAQLEAARLKQLHYVDKLTALIRNAIICMPTMPLPPRKRSDVLTKTVNDFDYKRVRAFIALSSVCKLPQLTIPVAQSPTPISVSLLGARGTDLFLLEQAESTLTARL
ncbi:MAG: hypothetical protein COV52_01735 [Gammaproteobacteria bacterium CG11_big_fil_rev_8_21_14_0_20_46_22]|nr:MAG: hypothetical protein COW05_05630 [Gammaproteobacteria bacterium CG12_big_fil_rev_8_21_14_0_65_46_12]PIR11835.1 MAG: hypothetical protein COV52_01735 [Gammaproteobacteria bacterium CG11_big_fil_rev_8_21_14_0_20_46_22]